VVGGHALPLAVRRAGSRPQDPLDEGGARQVVRRRMAGLEHPQGGGRASDDVASEADLHGLPALLDARRAWVVPDRLLAGPRPLGRRPHEAAAVALRVVCCRRAQATPNAAAAATPQAAARVQTRNSTAWGSLGG